MANKILFIQVIWRKRIFELFKKYNIDIGKYI